MNDRNLIAQMGSPATVTINNLKSIGTSSEWQRELSWLQAACRNDEHVSKKDKVESGPHTFHNEVEELWPWVALTLDGACVLAVVAYIHFLYLKAVLVLIPNTGHNGHAWVHGPFVIPCENDAWAIQPGAFRDPIQQVAPVAAAQKDGGVRCEENLLTEHLLLNILTPGPTDVWTLTFLRQQKMLCQTVDISNVALFVFCWLYKKCGCLKSVQIYIPLQNQNFTHYI